MSDFAPEPMLPLLPDVDALDLGEPTRLTVVELAAAYRSGALRPTEVTEAYLDRIEPGPVYVRVLAERAREQAARAAARFAAGFDAGPLQGVPLGIKDLFDLEGDVTGAGSPALRGERAGQPAAADAPALARLDAAGAVFLGRTGMTELAFSGLGINPHDGTPPNALDPSRIPGGSSSGSAVAVATGRAAAAIGSDTGGSVRIPAALNGIVGFKTSDGRIPVDGAVPLSTTLDTIGPIARTVDDAWIVYQALAADRPSRLVPTRGPLALAVPSAVLLADVDPPVARAFEAWLERIEAAGHAVERLELPELRDIVELYRSYGSFANHEAYALHRDLFARRGEAIDPRVAARILPFAERPAADYLALVFARRELAPRIWSQLAPFHAVLAPTVPMLAPATADLVDDDEAYRRANGRCLRNTMIFNFLGGPALSVPIAREATSGADRGVQVSVGGMVATAPGRDEAAARIARTLAAL